MTRYIINRNVNRPIEFKGLRGQYILYAGIALVSDLILFVILYLAGVNSYVCAVICLLLGFCGVGVLFRLSRKYGEHGWAKKRAARGIPSTLYHRSRSVFQVLKVKK